MRYSEEEKQFLRDTIPNYSHKKTSELFEEHFNKSISVTAVKNFGKYYKIKTKSDGRFKKGVRNNPDGEFKKGNKCHNELPNGSITTNHRNYSFIKESDKWIRYSYHIWKQSGRDIPQGYVLCFRDGDSTNVTLDNLRCVPKSATTEIMKNPHTKGIERDIVISIGELNELIKRKESEEE